MLRQIGKRLLTAIPSLIGVIVVTFLLTRVLPGDTAAGTFTFACITPW